MAYNFFLNSFLSLLTKSFNTGRARCGQVERGQISIMCPSLQITSLDGSITSYKNFSLHVEILIVSLRSRRYGLEIRRGLSIGPERGRTVPVGTRSADQHVTDRCGCDLERCDGGGGGDQKTAHAVRRRQRRQA